MPRIWAALLSAGVCLAGCEAKGPGTEGVEETGDGDGDPGDGDGDGEPGDGDGEPGDGDGEPGDGDGEPGDGDGEPGDGDGEPGDGDGEPGDGDGDGEGYEDWCPICVDPPANDGCGVVDNLQQAVTFTIPALDDYQFDMDETCTVASVSPTLIELDCETHDPQIQIDLVEPWVPNIEIGASLHLVASGYLGEWSWDLDWRLDHENDALALAGTEQSGSISGVGMGAIPVTTVKDACTPKCVGDGAIWRDIGLAFEHEGEQQTLFEGNHATVGGLEIWVTEAEDMICDHYGDSGADYANVFISAG